MTEGFREARRRFEVNKAHYEAIKEHAQIIRKQIDQLLEGTGFELDVDHWGTEKTVLRHFAPGATRYDYEIPLEET